MEMPRNRFKAALADGTRQLGLWVSLADPVAAEIAAGAGFDWVLIDGEHAPNDLRTVLHQLQAVAPYPVAPIVRPAAGDAVRLKQLLDLGAQTVLVPMVGTAAQAEELVRAVRYPPRGVRGVATARASRWGRAERYWEQADDETCLVVQIESVPALDQIEAIAAVDGVDALFVGPSDLGASLGHLGRPGAAEVVAATADAVRRIVAVGKPAGVLATSPELLGACIEAGASFVGVGVDTLLLARATSDLVERYRGQLDR